MGLNEFLLENGLGEVLALLVKILCVVLDVLGFFHVQLFDQEVSLKFGVLGLDGINSTHEDLVLNGVFIYDGCEL